MDERTTRIPGTKHEEAPNVLAEVTKNIEELRVCKKELASLRVAVCRQRKDGDSVEDSYYKNSLENLEKQLDLATEELNCERSLRISVEEELDRVLTQLNFYKRASHTEIVELEVKQLQQEYEKLLSALMIQVEPPAQNDTSPTVAPPVEKDKSNLGAEGSPEGDFSARQRYWRQCMQEAITRIDDLKVRLSRSETYAGEIAEAKCAAEDEYDKLSDKLELVTRQLEEAMEKVSEAVNLASTAAKERDEACEAQMRVEKERTFLREALKKLVDETASRVREEVEKVREQANANMVALLGEFQSLEEERAELAIEVERLRIVKQREDHSEKESHFDRETRFETTLQRALQAEKNYIEVKTLLEHERLAHDRTVGLKECEIKRLTDEMNLLRDRQQQMEKVVLLSQDKLRSHQGSLTTLEQKLGVAQREAAAAESAAKHEVRLAQQALELSEADAKRQVTALQMTHQKSTAHWRDMLTHQQQLAVRWKTEAHQLADQLEQQGKAFQAETESYKLQVEQLTSRLAAQARILKLK